MSSALAIAPLIFVRQFRLWAAAQSRGDHPLPHMQDAVRMFGASPELSVACASLFDLVEAQLGRRLEPECCCSSACSRDETALIGVLKHAPQAGQPFGSAAVPHGLPGAICWAAFAVRRALGESFADQFDLTGPGAERPASCPFNLALRPRVPAVA